MGVNDMCAAHVVAKSNTKYNFCSEQALAVSKTSLERATIVLFVGTKLKKRGASKTVVSVVLSSVVNAIFEFCANQ